MCGLAAAGVGLACSAFADDDRRGEDRDKPVRKPQVVVISLDGAKPDLIERYLRTGVLDRRSGLGALARSRSFDVRRYPTLSFDYCLDPGTFVNLLVLTSRGRFEVQLTNEYGGSELLGSVPGARADMYGTYQGAIELAERMQAPAIPATAS
jgi:hypothetical protein